MSRIYLEWTDFRVRKPEDDIIAIVANEKGYMTWTRAMYSVRYDCWKLYDPDYRDGLTLEVTHYIPIPAPPMIK